MKRRFNTAFPKNEQLDAPKGTPVTFSHYLVAEVSRYSPRSNTYDPLCAVRIPICEERNKRRLREMEERGEIEEDEGSMDENFFPAAEKLTKRLLDTYLWRLNGSATDPLGFQRDGVGCGRYLYEDDRICVEATIVPRKRAKKSKES